MLGVVAGSEAYPGAAVLCTTAAAEAGVGMLRYVGTPTPVGLVHQAVPEAVVGDGRVQAWVVGPGLDTEAADDDARRPSSTPHVPPWRATCPSSSTPGDSPSSTAGATRPRS